MTINHEAHKFLNIPEFKKQTAILNSRWEQLMAFCKELNDSGSKSLTNEKLEEIMNKHFGVARGDFIKFYNTFAHFHDDLRGKYSTLTYTKVQTDEEKQRILSLEETMYQENPMFRPLTQDASRMVNVNPIPSMIREPFPNTEEGGAALAKKMEAFIIEHINPHIKTGGAWGDVGATHVNNLGLQVDWPNSRFTFTYDRQTWNIPFSGVKTILAHMDSTIRESGTYLWSTEITWLSYENAAVASEMQRLIQEMSNRGENGLTRLYLALSIITYPQYIIEGTLFHPYRQEAWGPASDWNAFFAANILPRLQYDPQQVGDAYLTEDGRLSMVWNNVGNNGMQLISLPRDRNGTTLGLRMIVLNDFVAVRYPNGSSGNLGSTVELDRQYLRGRIAIIKRNNLNQWWNDYRNRTQQAFTMAHERRRGDTTRTVQGGMDSGLTFDLNEMRLVPLRQGAKQRSSYHAYQRINGFWSEDGVDSNETQDKNGNPRLYFGCEIETEVRGSENFIFVVTNLITHNFPWINNWVSPERDGSLRDGGIEWVATPTTPVVAIEMARLFVDCGIVKTCLFTHSGCGGHIHISRSYFTATSFAKFFRFIGGDSLINKNFTVAMAERESNRGQFFEKSLTDGELIHKAHLQRKGLAQLTPTERQEYDTTIRKHGGRESAINVVPPHTYECRMFHSQVDYRLVKNIQFLYAAVRFSTYIHRCKLSSGDFIRWLYRWKDNHKQYPEGTFDELLRFIQEKCKLKGDDGDGSGIYNILLKDGVISPATTAAQATLLEKEQKKQQEKLTAKK